MLRALPGQDVALSQVERILTFGESVCLLPCVHVECVHGRGALHV